ncbi:MAG: hypothetical protein CMN73_02675 [Sphingomonas sp.]|nr:hypothetical protein [Sphingomonas sp.]|tara:strand:+ start:798 stop:1535 length:738 start_codon:yes stop_codon:yes gene_type:complete
MANDSDDERRAAMRDAALDLVGIKARMAFAQHTAETFKDVGTKLHAWGHMLGTDRRNGLSPFGHGDDAAVAVSMLLRIASEIVSGCADLVASGRHYAGAALVRQLVEVEYLAWAFETKDEEAARWLRSTREERERFFKPSKLRKASGGRFRGTDYSYHCELGGHPVPGSWRLLTNAEATGQLMLFDCLTHSTHIWGHVFEWAKGYMLGQIIADKHEAMVAQFTEWQRVDGFTVLPPPPMEDVAKL